MNLWFALVTLSLGNAVLGMRNITVDNQDASITYTGVWNPISNQMNALAYDNGHAVSFDRTAKATWQFTGIAFYYIASRWAYPVNTIINIDDGNITANIDLDDHSLPQTESGLPQSDTWSVLWGSGQMQNTQHTVIASMPQNPGAPLYVVVDAFMYTVLDPADETPTSSAVASTVTSAVTSVLSSAKSSATASAKSSSSKISPGSVAVAVIAVVAICAAIALWLFFRNRRRNQAAVVTQTFEDVPTVMHQAPSSASERPFSAYSSLNQWGHLVPVHPKTAQYNEVRKLFYDGWQHPQKPAPPLQSVFAVVSSQEVTQPYINYRAAINASLSSGDNEKLLFHGTNRECLVGESIDNMTLCGSQTCCVCCIIKTSYDIRKSGLKNNFRRFGTGIYTTACSSKADDYVVNLNNNAAYRALLLNYVVVGKSLRTKFNNLKLQAVPAGFHSIFGEPGNHLNYEETVVFNNDAIRPAFLVVYGEELEEKS